MYLRNNVVHQFFCNLVRNFVVEPSSGSCWKMTRGVPIISWREEALLLSVLLLLFPQLFHTSLTGKCRSQKQIGRYIVYIYLCTTYPQKLLCEHTHYVSQPDHIIWVFKNICRLWDWHKKWKQASFKKHIFFVLQNVVLHLTR